jgi:hypothetical protein
MASCPARKDRQFAQLRQLEITEMALADRIRTADPSRFIGRPGRNCRKCGGTEHYVNRVGGIACVACSPPETEGDCQIRLNCSGGVWVDLEFERCGPAESPPVAVQDADAAQSDSLVAFINSPTFTAFMERWDRDATQPVGTKKFGK